MILLVLCRARLSRPNRHLGRHCRTFKPGLTTPTLESPLAHLKRQFLATIVLALSHPQGLLCGGFSGFGE